jgi:hypothetical protein
LQWIQRCIAGFIEVEVEPEEGVFDFEFVDMMNITGNKGLGGK